MLLPVAQIPASLAELTLELDNSRLYLQIEKSVHHSQCSKYFLPACGQFRTGQLDHLHRKNEECRTLLFHLCFHRFFMCCKHSLRVSLKSSCCCVEEEEWPMICISGFSTTCTSLTSISRPLRPSSPQVYSKMLDHIQLI